MTEYCEYRRGKRTVIAETHHYQQRGGRFRTTPDPKMVLIGESRYVLDPGD